MVASLQPYKLRHVFSVATVLGAWALFVVALHSCTSEPYYYKAYEIDPSGWAYDQTKVFDFEIGDTSKTYRMDLQIDHLSDYAYQNIYLKLKITDAVGRSNTQIIPIDFATKSGIWYSKCRGKNCYLDAVLRDRVRFDQSGTYSISIAQYTREPALKGIDKIALVVDYLSAE